MAMIRSSIGYYLRYSLAATFFVLVPPLLVVTAVALTVRTATPLMLAAVGAVTIAVFAAFAGAVWWRRRPESVDVSFGELMLWSFVRRWRAESRAERDAEVLGLDRKGRPGRRINLSAIERLRVLQDLATALEAKDPYTHGHSTRVEHLVGLTAQRLGLSDDECEELRLAASLHDVGKIRVPAYILRKPARLTIDEKLIVQEHSAVGAWLVSDISNGAVSDSVRHHHERWDGNGYPDGLATTDIPLFSRIIAVADAYDAMTSSRPYRPSLDRRSALEELKKKAGVQFDPAVVNAFVEVVPDRSIVAGVVALGGLGPLFRRAAAWSVRTGQGSVAPAVGAVGAASVVIGLMFSPPVALTKPPVPGRAHGGGAASAPETVVSAATTTLQRRASGTTVKVGRRSREAAVREKRSGGAPRAEDPNRVLGSVLVRGALRHGSAAEQAVGPESKAPNPPDGGGGSPDPGGSTGGPPGKGRPPGDPGSTRPPKAQGPKVAHGDPQPERGRDCLDHPEQGARAGNAKHCAN